LFKKNVADYALCGSGRQQTPIQLFREEMNGRSDGPTFSYPSSIRGTLTNWGYGPDFELSTTRNSSSRPSIRFQESEDSEPETVYLASFHTHAPSEHIIDGQRTQAELHLVHTTQDGTPRSVVGYQIAPSDDPVPNMFQEMPKPLPQDDESEELSISLNGVGTEGRFWTYQGQ
jgi:carbonic anhydrase